MKKLLTLIVLITPLLSYAQLEKGMFLLSGNVSYQKNGYDNPSIVTTTDLTKIELTPYIGYLVSPKVAVGLLANYQKTKQEYTISNVFSPSSSTQDAFMAGPFVRFYQPITERFFFFAQGDIQFGRGTGESVIADGSSVSKAKMTATAVAVRPGISYFVSRRWAIELILGSVSYSDRTFKSNSTTTNMDGFGFNFITRGLSPGVVFTF